MAALVVLEELLLAIDEVLHLSEGLRSERRGKVVTYEVDGDGVVSWQVCLAIDRQEREALALAGELRLELFG